MTNFELFGVYAAFAKVFQQNFQRMMDACGDDEGRKQAVDLAYLDSQIAATRAGVVLLERDQPIVDAVAKGFADAANEAMRLLKIVQADEAALKAIGKAVKAGTDLLKNA